jgi:hypothetical protein
VYGNYDAPQGYADFESYVAGAQLKYQVVKGLTIGGEVFCAGTRSDAVNIINAQAELLSKDRTNAVVGGIRIERKS